MGLETYEKKAYIERHVKAEQNKQRIRVFWVTASCTPEQVCVRMSSACVCRLVHAYANPYLEILINTKTK